MLSFNRKVRPDLHIEGGKLPPWEFLIQDVSTEWAEEEGTVCPEAPPSRGVGGRSNTL